MKVTVLILATACVGQAPLPERVEFQLRNGVENQRALKFFGKDAASRATVDAEGLRIVLPADRKSLGVIGVESPLRLRGDFEVTLRYELLALPEINPQLTVGVQLVLKLDSQKTPSVAASRVQRAKGPFFSGNYAVPGPEEKNQFKIMGNVPATEPKGRLRLVRNKDKLIYYGADGDAELRELWTLHLGNDDVLAVRAQCTTTSRPVSLEARLIDLEIRAAEIVNKDLVRPEEKVVEQVGGRGAFWGIVVGAVLLVAGVGTYFSRRRRPG